MIINFKLIFIATRELNIFQSTLFDKVIQIGEVKDKPKNKNKKSI
jgi:hypothetical protein